MPIQPKNFIVNAADLAYILRQIIIAEKTSIGYTPLVAPVSIVQAIMDEYNVSAINASQLPAGLRTVDGTFNNLLIAPTGTPGTPGYIPGSSEFGAADTLFPRLTTPVYNNDADGDQIAFGPPGSGAPVITNTNYALTGSVADADPRIISNLIVDMSVNNPAAISTWFNNPLALAAFDAAHPGMTPVAPGDANAGQPGYLVITNEDLQTIPNQSPDIGLSPGFNSWMTYFGQFFDHGLDLVTKGNAGTVYIPLQADDPLIAGADGIVGNADDLPAHLRFMALTRATQTLDANGIPQHENTTTSWIDQNQTYTSNASHQVFLREYVKVDVAGDGLGPVAVSTGRLLDGTAATGSVAGAIGNWTDVKAQALTMLGIRLGDFDIHNAPLLLTDQYGKFIPGANGYAQLVMAPDATHATNWLKEGTALVTDADGNVTGGITTAGSIGTGHAFLNDIAHHAAPGKYDHDNNPATPKVNQTADLDIQDINRDGKIDASEILANNRDVNRDGVVNAADLVADDGVAGTYDDEMLNAHFITGDGRGNENIALTAVHSIFHSEHNRLVEANKVTILATASGGDVAFLNEWLVVDVTSVPANLSTLVWDGDRLFQAARFSTEMQYQHLVFEEFARRIQPFVDPFVFQNSPNIDPSIVAEFAHTVYRFGHSMLTGTVDRLENDLTTVNGDMDQKTLLAVFLNPQAYIGSGATLEEINANIIRGLSRDVGNAIDEFIITDVRSNLLGLPLDLGALNIARGRDTGIPSLNETRAQLYNDTGLADLKPYISWADFAANMKNAASIVNFIAAYGTHGALTAADVDTLAEKRAVAEALVFGGSATINAGTAQQRVFTANQNDRLDFINATGIYARDGAGPNDDSRGGLENIDLWIGGLAEASPEFGGMLGTTFNYVFEAQMEALQDGDRLYYLSRTQGQNIINQLESNTFADLVMRNTALGDQYATHLNGFLFTTPDLILELDSKIAQEDYNGSDSGLDPTWAVGEPHSPFDQKVTRTSTGVTDANGHDVGGTLRYIGGQHVVLGGTEGDDKLYGDRGIDTLWGDGGNDYLNAGTESDNVFGGDGDDIIEDPFGDDLLRGNAGNDVITSARGFDILFGNEGQDAIFLGQDAGEVFGGTDTDFILGGNGVDGLAGNEGDDWIEGGQGLDLISGDNSEIFFNSLIIGNDVLFGQGDENDYDAESGDDIGGSGPGITRFEGMYGFDYAIAKGDITGVKFDLTKAIFLSDPDAVLLDRFDHVEAMSGYVFDDILYGDSRGHFTPGTVTTAATADGLFINDILTQTGINLINGFNAWFGGGDATDARQTLFGGPTPLVIGTEGTTSFRDGNIILGGDGNDTMAGRGGYDLLDGDAYLNVRIGIFIATGPNAGYYSAESLQTDKTQAGPHAGLVFRMVGNNPLGDVDFSNPAFSGRSLNSLLLDRTINPGQMSIVREIKYDATNVTGALMNVDTAVFQGTLAEYDIEGRSIDANGFVIQAHDVNGDGFISVTDRDNGVTGATVNGVVLPSRRLLIDDTDLIKNIEELRFADQTLILSGPNLPKGPTLDLHAFDLVTTTAAQYRDEFTDPVFNNSQGTTPWTTSWAETGDGANAVAAGQIQIDGFDSDALRFIGGTVAADFDGASITRSVNLGAAGSTTLSYDYSFSRLDTGDTLKVEFAANGTDFVTIQTVAGATAVDATQAPTTFSVTVNGTSNSALRFTTTALTLGESIRIDDVNFVTTNTTQVVAADGTGFTATFTEDGAAVAIASNAVITDPNSTMIFGARVRLTNAQALDVLSVAGALPAGISSSFGPAVAGEITLNLSGSASLAAYQTAIQAVRYATTSQNPSVTPRNIEVILSDGLTTGPASIATVNIVPVNDAPILDLHAFNVVTTTVAQYVDQFTNPVFNNTQGTTPWTTSWAETGDGANAVAAGQIQIDGFDSDALRFIGGTVAADFDGASITRSVDLSTAGTTTLSYAYSFSNLDTGDTLTVEFAADGINFVPIQTVAGAIAVNATQAPTTFSVTVSGTSASALRFTTTALTLGESIRIDDVTFATTTSALVPVANGTGFTATFTEDGAAVAIASNAGITDVDSTLMVGAQVRLTNAQAFDVLAIVGALPGGITSSVGPAVAGVITLNLTGSASMADYQAAIQAVRYSNTSQNPSVIPRNIAVTLNDGVTTGPAAIATVNVVSVNDAPVAVADTVLTNVAIGTAFVVPEWVLLANDSDIEGAVLDINLLSNSVGLSGLSLATNPNSVTLADAGAPGGSFTYRVTDGALVNATSTANVTVANQSLAQVADNFNGAGGAVRSAANNSTGVTPWTTSWVEAADDGNILLGQVQIDSGGNPGSNNLRFLGGAAGTDGASISRVVDLSGAANATLTFSFVKAGVDLGESVLVQFAADGINFTTVQTLDNTGAATGTTAPLVLTGTYGATSAIRLVGSAMNAGTSIAIDNLRIDYTNTLAPITGTAANEILVGNDNGSAFSGGVGNDTVLANGGDDTINWAVGDGRDFVDGGANGALGDRFIVQGDNTVENFVVYARAAAISAGITVQNAATEIVVVRNSVVVAELDNIEEITINTAGGDDIVTAIGDFNPTQLRFNTITVNGGEGRDTIDASLLSSAHRLVLNPGADNAVLSDDLAPQRFVELDGMGRGLMHVMMRMGHLDLDSGGDFGFVGSRQHGGFVESSNPIGGNQNAGAHHNPMFDRTPAMDFDTMDFSRDFRFEHRALHFDAADYLIS